MRLMLMSEGKSKRNSFRRKRLPADKWRNVRTINETLLRRIVQRHAISRR
jgi:hypothetical protein